MGTYAEGDRVRNTHYGYTGTVLQSIGIGRYLVGAEVGDGVTVKVEADAGYLVPVVPVERVPWDDQAWVDGRDETPAACTTTGCGRTRPRWTMTVIGNHLVCSPTFAMHCAVCGKPGEYLTHYTMDEHRHALCVVDGCGTEVPEGEAYCDEHKRELAGHPEHFA
jgi:predicted nucleic acid-binding Zn ribbon protein